MQALHVQWHDTLPSTNTFLRRLLAEDPSLRSGTVVAARNQTAGRGRFNRDWVMGPGKDLAFSLLVRAETDPVWIPSLPMAAALAVAKALITWGLAARLKWPNDVLVDGRKICGILSEYVPTPSRALQTAIVGIGVNVNMEHHEAAAIGRPVTSLFIETGKRTTVDDVLESVLAELPGMIGRWEQGGFPSLREDWGALAYGIGRPVSVGEEVKKQTGILTGFGEQGELLLTDSQGQEHAVFLGDVPGRPQN